MKRASFFLIFLMLMAAKPVFAEDLCGDFVIGPTETCEDGCGFDGCDAFDDGDGCSSTCSIETGWSCSDFDLGNGQVLSFCSSICGDNLVVGFEGCDDGLTCTDGTDCNADAGACIGIGDNSCLARNGDGCDDDTLAGGNCSPTGCANGVVTDGEACDDFNPFDGDGCSADCSAVEPGWTCDNSFGFSFCTPICGDGILIEGLEECEDGNGVNGDGCDDDVNDPLTPGNCTFTACGNFVISPDEECDDGKQCPDGSPCLDATYCFGIGDETCQPRDAKFAFDGFSFDVCDSNCTAPACGNGILNHIDNESLTLIEECDDGNQISGDGCDNNCTATTCGNGILTVGELCEDGNTENDDGCSAECQPECGDGAQGLNEECDDGNVKSSDGCSSVCTLETEPNICGNGLVERGEECDDGNTDSGDGCESNCTDQSFESANPALTFSGLFVGDSVILNAPDPRNENPALALKSAVLPEDCSCTWTVAPVALGNFSDRASCQTQLNLTTEGDGTLSVEADCGAEGSETFLQTIVVQPKPVEDSGGCSLIR